MSIRSALMLAVALALPSAPGTAATDLGGRLGQLLQSLDDDQSRRLTRARSQADAAFEPTDAGAVIDMIGKHRGPVVIMVGKRMKPSGVELDANAPMLLVEGGQQETLAPEVRSRSGYQMKAKPDSGWASVFNELGIAVKATRSAQLQNATLKEANAALAQPSSAAFVFFLAPSAGSTTVEKLVVVPDTVMINVAGDPTATTPAKAAPTRSAPAPVEFAPPSPPPPPPPSPPPGPEPGSSQRTAPDASTFSRELSQPRQPVMPPRDETDDLRIE